jgi:hypothetical protein
MRTLDTLIRKPFIWPDARETMANSDYWHDLGARFRALVFHHSDPTYRSPVCASWTQTAGDGTRVRWTLFEGDQSTRLQVEALARRGASALNSSDNRDLLSTWLDTLRDIFPNKFKAEGTKSTIGVRLHEDAGVLRGIAAISADLCSMLESQALEEEYEPPSHQPEEEHKPAPKQFESLAQQLTRLRDQCHLTVEEIAEQISIDARSVYRHLSGASKPHKRHIAAYERVFSKALDTKVVIGKLSDKRQ